LSRTLAGLKLQTFHDWKAVVIDDGSTDSTWSLAQAAAKKDDRISVHRISHSGVSSARNHGLGEVDTEWVCFLDADDWLRPDFSRIMLKAANSNVDLVYCGYERITPEGETIPLFSNDFLDKGFECVARECPTAIHSVIIRRNLAESLGGFDTSLETCEDWDFWQRAARAGARIGAVPELLAMYQMRQGSLSRQYPQLIADAHRVIRRGFSVDARVKHPSAAAAKGAHGDDEVIRRSFFTAWCAAAEVGAGKNGAALLTAYDCDFGGHLFELGKCLATALAIGAKRSLADLALILPQLRARYQSLVDELAGNQRPAGTARGISYAVERVALQQLPSGKSAELSRMSKIAVDLKAISGFVPSPGIDVAILEFLSDKRSQGQMEIAVFGACSAGDVARFALDFLGLRDFVRSSGLLGRLDYYTLASLLVAKGVCNAVFQRFRQRSDVPLALRSAVVAALKQAAVRQASRGEPPIHRQLERKAGMHATAADQPTVAVTDSANAVHSAEALSSSEYWNRFFGKEDPWNYGCDYEQIKYRRTLEIMPPDSNDRVLELACAEGIFTQRLAACAKKLIATDISDVALKRARERCSECANTLFRQLDLVADEIPGDQTLIICSEVLYYVGRERLSEIAKKLRDALAAGGRLVTANAFVLADDMSSTGFDWNQDYGAKAIHEAFLATEGLALERSIVTDLYRIDCFKRCEPQEVLHADVRHLDLGCRLDPLISQQIVWGGAGRRRDDLIKQTQCWQIPILAYHRVATDGPISLRRWRVEPEMFRNQLRLLRAHGYYSITSDDLLKARAARRPLPGRPVLITFDDGYQDFADTAWPILEAEGFRAEVFIVTDRVGASASWDSYDGVAPSLMSWRTIQALHARGVRFGSHLATHTPATNLSSHGLLCEVIRSRADLEARLGVPVVTIASPHGATDERYHRLLASAGYQLEFSGDGKKADLRQHCYGLPRLQIEGWWSMDDFARAIEISPLSPSKHLGQRLVTVVVPAYNAERTIDETLCSARYQTHANLEILVVDDGSKDATADIVLRHAAIDSRVRLITQANGGVAAARNRGIAEAKSDLIAPLDSDDLWAPTKIEKQLQAMSQGGAKVALVYTWFAVIDEKGNVRDLEHQPLDCGPVLQRMCRGNLVGNGSSPLMRKSAILEAGGFDPGLRSAHAQGCEDLLLYFRISERHEFAVVPEHLTGYRRHADAMSEDALQMLRSYRLVAEEMSQKYPEYLADIRFGEANLADWLIRKALRKCRFGLAAEIFSHIAHTDLRFSLATFLPGVLMRGGLMLVRPARTGPKPIASLTFGIGSPTDLKVSS
jgi:glycosyltransferase involved in cell wall biosynthesis/peptidoglycan/xylan/chitin deacetylase (PgdA/CDA1 family)/SAM-dependent methyltransferase